MPVFELTIILTFFFVALVKFFRSKYSYWKKRNLPYLCPQFPFGNITAFQLKEKPGIILQQFYRKIKKNGWKHGGIYIFTKPLYLVVDLEYVKNILAKNFDHFDDRGVYYNQKNDPLSAHLLYIGGLQWKILRNKLNPTFTSFKIRNMLPIMMQCADNLVKTVEKQYEQNIPIDVENLISYFAVDNIGSCAFGFDCGMFNNDSLYEFCLKKCPEMSRFALFTLIIASMFPNVSRILGVKHYPKEVTGFFLKLVRNCVEYRKKNSYFRQDFMQLLIDLHDKKMLSLEEMAAQCLIFFLAGYETSTLVITFALYELAKNTKIQERIREDIKSKADIADMKYMKQVVDETMRKYPAVMYLTRRCTKNFAVPNENLIIEKGTMVIIPNYAIHYDEEYYPDPEKFEPERFNDENKMSRHNYAHLPFGEGPRICIGKQFGLMTVKVALISLLKNFKFTINSKTSEPLKMTINSIVLKPEKKIWLNVNRV